MSEQANESMSFWGHIEQLRKHLIRSAIAIIIFAIFAFINKSFIFHNIILAPKESYFITNKLFCKLSELFSIPTICINQFPLKIINIELAGQFTTHITVSIISGIILAIPYIFWELWRFIKPALHKHEQKSAKNGVFKASLLFFAGILFSYFLIVPLAINFLGSYQVSAFVENQISLKSYINTVTMVTFATGVVFELPVFIYFLSRIGLVTPEFLIKNRRIAIVLILIVSAIITPPDVFSQILVGIPLYILYEFSIGIARKQYKKRNSE